MTPEPEPNAEPLQPEAGDPDAQVAALSAEVLRYEGVMASSRYRLHQREQGILVLAELQRAVGEDLPLARLLERVVRVVNARMGMDRAVVLAPKAGTSLYTPVEWAGYPDGAGRALGTLALEVPVDALGDPGPLLVNASTPASPAVDRLREALGLPYFVCTPIGSGPSAVGLLFTGRTVEEAPDRPPLDKGDVVTVQAIAGLVFACEQAREVAELKVERERRRLEAREVRELTEARRRLQETQAALVEQDRLASLGRLTAGVAHEIKNPLNFINNFAALSVELVDEIAALFGAPGGGAERAEIGDLLADLRANVSRIEEHGRRADAIVRSMLMHSRADAAEQREVDLNALVEEHVDLAYYGIFAEVPGFAVHIARDYAEGLGSVEVVPQDVGRVLINLLGNAFAAVRERAEREGAGYDPAVTVATRDAGDHVEIRIADNGPGIPEDVRAKVFEPFFTTKPPGMGTGLGLSLSHDLVTRGHGGRLEVESDGRSGTTFVVTLPRVRVVTPVAAP